MASHKNDNRSYLYILFYIHLLNIQRGSAAPALPHGVGEDSDSFFDLQLAGVGEIQPNIAVSLRTFQIEYVARDERDALFRCFYVQPVKIHVGSQLAPEINTPGRSLKFQFQVPRLVKAGAHQVAFFLIIRTDISEISLIDSFFNIAAEQFLGNAVEADQTDGNDIAQAFDQSFVGEHEGHSDSGRKGEGEGVDKDHVVSFVQSFEGWDSNAFKPDFRRSVLFNDR